jgi:hypothetical protein
MPFGQALETYREGLAYRFLAGEYQHVTGGFPSVAFHDGYRELDYRMQSWMSPGDTRFTDSELIRWIAHYEAGAFALHLEKSGWNESRG